MYSKPCDASFLSICGGSEGGSNYLPFAEGFLNPSNIASDHMWSDNVAHFSDENNPANYAVKVTAEVWRCGDKKMERLTERCGSNQFLDVISNMYI